MTTAFRIHCMSDYLLQSVTLRSGIFSLQAASLTALMPKKQPPQDFSSKSSTTTLLAAGQPLVLRVLTILEKGSYCSLKRAYQITGYLTTTSFSQRIVSQAGRWTSIPFWRAMNSCTMEINYSAVQRERSCQLSLRRLMKLQKAQLSYPIQRMLSRRQACLAYTLFQSIMINLHWNDSFGQPITVTLLSLATLHTQGQHTGLMLFAYLMQSMSTF